MTFLWLQFFLPISHSMELVLFQELHTLNGQFSQLNFSSWTLFGLKWKIHFYTNTLIVFESVGKLLFQTVLHTQVHAKISPKSDCMVPLNATFEIQGDSAKCAQIKTHLSDL